MEIPLIYVAHRIIMTSYVEVTKVDHVEAEKGKQGLQYLRMCISCLEKDYEESHPRLLSEYNLYEKMKERVYVKNNIDN